VFILHNLGPFLNGFRGPGIPIGSYERDFVHDSISNAAKQCDIDPIRGQFIVTDDLTYGYFRRSHGPISFTYNFVGYSKTPLNDLFMKTDSSGMILDCSAMPPAYRDQSIRVNNICCLSRNQIKKLFINN
jgi:hypothetical protein